MLYIQEALAVAKEAASLNLNIVTTWLGACSSIPLQLSDWHSRFIDELEIFVNSGRVLKALKGISFSLGPHYMMALPSGRRAKIRCKGPHHREKLGFNFRELAPLSRRVRPQTLPMVPEISEMKRKVRELLHCMVMVLTRLGISILAR
jgi:hypothetical protein